MYLKFQDEDRRLAGRLRHNNVRSLDASPVRGTLPSTSAPFQTTMRGNNAESSSSLLLENQRLRVELQAARQAMHSGAAGNLAAASGLQAELEQLRSENTQLRAAGGDGQQSVVLSLGELLRTADAWSPQPCCNTKPWLAMLLARL